MITIAWDIDDVLNDLMNAWFTNRWLPDHPGCGVKYEGLTENPPHGLLGADLNEYLASLDRFRLSGLYPAMEPVPEVMEWFSEHGGMARHAALTAVPLLAAHVSAEWVMRHFGTWLRSFHFVPSGREDVEAPEYDGNKGDFLKRMNSIDILVDDNENNIRGAEAAGVKGILFPRPWNSSRLEIKDVLEELTGLAVKAGSRS